jgi:hypothetical protein
MRYLMLTYFYQANGKIDEGMTVATRVRTKDRQTANVILDFKEQKVLKASVRDTAIPKDWDRIVSYYHQHYASTIERLFRENGYEIVKPEETKDQPQPAAANPS